jgi:hypothetical protein
MNIQSKYAALTVQIKEGGPTAAGKPAHRSLNDPSLGEQFLNNERDSTSLKAGNARQVGSRDRLPGSYLVEDKISIDLAWDFVRRAHFIDER